MNFVRHIVELCIGPDSCYLNCVTMLRQDRQSDAFSVTMSVISWHPPPLETAEIARGGGELPPLDINFHAQHVLNSPPTQLPLQDETI